jgi:hypothetical protein
MVRGLGEQRDPGAGRGACGRGGTEGDLAGTGEGVADDGQGRRPGRAVDPAVVEQHLVVAEGVGAGGEGLPLGPPLGGVGHEDAGDQHGEAHGRHHGRHHRGRPHALAGQVAGGDPPAPAQAPGERPRGGDDHRGECGAAEHDRHAGRQAGAPRRRRVAAGTLGQHGHAGGDRHEAHDGHDQR